MKITILSLKRLINTSYPINQNDLYDNSKVYRMIYNFGELKPKFMSISKNSPCILSHRS